MSGAVNLPQPKRSAQFVWLPTVDEAFEAMLSAIARADRSVRLETYIYTAGPVGERFRDALTAAAQRGVCVRVLIDAWGSVTLPDSFWQPLVGAGGEVRRFNPLHLKCCGFRNHRKLLVCDEQFAFVGGFNISTEYQGDGLSKGWHDCGLSMAGPLAKTLAESFDQLFSVADFRHRRFASLRRTEWRKAIPTPDGDILLAGPGRGSNLMIRSLLSDLARANCAQMICAYFLPTRAIRRLLIRRARQGAKVQLLLAGKSDVPLSRLAARRFYDSFLRAGVEIFEYQPQVLHAKLFLLDDIVYVGSANLDRRSCYINYELMLRLPNASLAAQGRTMFECDLSHSEQIRLPQWRRSRGLWTRWIEHFAFFVLARVDPYIARRQLKTLR